MPKPKDVEYVRIIASLERLRRSRNGNPRFQITFTDGFVAKTQVDAGLAYGLENPENLGVPVHVKATPSGLVYSVKPVDPNADAHTTEEVNQ